MKRTNYKAEFYDLAKEAHGSKYNYSLVTNIENAKSKVKIICPIHGQFTQEVYRHCKDKRGCPDCGVLKRAESHTSNLHDVIKKAKQVHGNKYTYDKFVYRNAKEKSIVTCLKHGDFSVNANNLHNGKGCPDCGREQFIKHGLSGSKLDKVYYAMVQRCYREDAESYKYYGGRGVTVCDEWLEDNVKFFEWAMANGYEDGLSIDKDEICAKLKIDPPIYSPHTCQWVTPAHQRKHQRERGTC